MTHAPQYWANKFQPETPEYKDMLIVFWHLVNDWGFSGETAYCRVLAGERKIMRRA